MTDFDLNAFPTRPGVYLMHDGSGTVIYVGKAKNLRSRLRNYFGAGGDSRPQVRFLLARVERIETIVTDTEKEALILENTLIKRHRPRYNISLRDDKTYISLRIDPHEEFPALQLVRRVARDGALYFGPYASSAAVKGMLKELHRIFPLRRHPLASCRQRPRPCLFHQIGQCSAPCHGRISPEAYAELVAGVIDFLSGRTGAVTARLTARMQAAAAALRFEDAARLRDQMRAATEMLERQKVVAAAGDLDVFGLCRQEGEVEIAVLFIRSGRLIGRRTVSLAWRLDEEELLAGVLQQFYDGEVFIPETILLPSPAADTETIGAWLSERRGRKVELLVPQRGERVQLVAMAARNAEESFRERGSRREAREGVLAELAKALHLDRTPRRIECYDISNLQGGASVGSMAVSIDGEAAPKEYRHFRIRTVTGADDYASLLEILRRRLSRGLKEDNLPDLIVIDGGKGQLAVLTAALQELGLDARIAAASLAKSRVTHAPRSRKLERSEERVFLPGRLNPVQLRSGSPALFLLARLRDEAHRFAITHHRRLRAATTLRSALGDIPGIGPARQRLLLKYFGSLKRLAAAPLEALLAVPGLPAALATAIHLHYRAERLKLEELSNGGEPGATGGGAADG